jgi:hypothetical protein
MAEEKVSELLACPFCKATPHRGLTKAQADQLHGEPFQRYRIWCPHGCANIERMNEEQAREAWNAAETGDVSVKPLVWDRITSDQLLAGSEILGGETALAPSIFGDYQVWGEGTWRTPHSLGAQQTTGNGGTLATGMEAAQADYEARILSALVSPSIKREA